MTQVLVLLPGEVAAVVALPDGGAAGAQAAHMATGLSARHVLLLTPGEVATVGAQPCQHCPGATELALTVLVGEPAAELALAVLATLPGVSADEIAAFAALPASEMRAQARRLLDLAREGGA